MPGAEKLVRTMKAHGAQAVLVSGGFKFFTSRVADHCGFDRDLANELEIIDGKLTGQVFDPILDRQTKLQTLVGVAAEHALPLALTMAVGDGANDLEMIKAAGLGVAYHAKPVVAAEARARIDHGDLTALLFAQGYGEDEIVS
jgi:phosphoserine phosphatase